MINGVTDPKPHISSAPSNRIFGLKTFIYFAMLTVGVAAAASFEGAAEVPFQIIIGLAFAHGIELQHQALHYSGFTRRGWNETAGVIFGLPMLVSFSDWQAAHVVHHQMLGTKDNREFFDYGDRSRFILGHFCEHFLMTRHYARIGSRLKAALMNKKPDDIKAGLWSKIRKEYLLMLGLFVIAAAFFPSLLWRFWLAPLILIATPVHALIELPEHFGCDHLDRSVFANTRSIRSNRFTTWFTNGNNFHVEHHAWPNVPNHRLGALHRHIESSLSYRHESYLAFYLWFLNSRMNKH